MIFSENFVHKTFCHKAEESLSFSYIVVLDEQVTPLQPWIKNVSRIFFFFLQ